MVKIAILEHTKRHKNPLIQLNIFIDNNNVGTIVIKKQNVNHKMFFNMFIKSMINAAKKTNYELEIVRWDEKKRRTTKEMSIKK